jgi:hypothetical protein
MSFSTLLFLLWPLTLTPGTLNLVELRQQLDQAANSKVKAQQFNERFKQVTEGGQPILVGFKALSELILCKHVFSPISKLAHFRKGRNLLEKAIAASPNNPELSFLRFTTQSNVPSLLNYSGNIMQDKSVLINYLRSTTSKAADPDLYQRVKSYLQESKFCTAGEVKLIKSL